MIGSNVFDRRLTLLHLISLSETGDKTLTLVGLHFLGGALVVGGRGRWRVAAPRRGAALRERRAQLRVAAGNVTL